MRIRKKVWAMPELMDCGYYFQNPTEQKGKWQSFFGNKAPIHLDLGCGKGVFLAENAFKHQDINFIGVDISVDILGVARRNIAEYYKDKPVKNIAMFSYDIEKILDTLSLQDGIARIYVNFCNPWPKSRGHKKRLTHTRQLELYKKLLAPGGEIWFKTDSQDLYIASKRYFKEAGLKVFLDTQDLHSENVENVFSEHENMFTKQGIKTKAIRAIYEGG